jgi:hypothetical protein
VLKIAIVWLGLVAAVLAGAGALVPPAAPVLAQADQCRAQCEALFAQCYRASNANRKVCDAQRTQCLEACIRKR